MQKVILVAVDVRSTHNVGSFLRSADGFSAELVLVGITPRPNGDPNDDRLPHVIQKADSAIAKTALGAEHNVPWKYYSDVFDAVKDLKSDGFTVVALEQSSNSKPISELNSNIPTAILVGPEVEGLPNKVLELCDEIYEIPMTGKKESFNVAVSAGIALYQARN